MKKWIGCIAITVMLMGTSSMVLADHPWHDRHWGDATGDEAPESFGDGYRETMQHFKDGFLFFPGAEIGFGSGTLSAALGVNIGYKTGMFFAGTALKGQIVNIDRVNYRFMPLTLNICGLSLGVIPETVNSQNDKTLRGRSIGFAAGGKLTFSQLVESDPVTDSEEEFLMFTLGFGF